MIHIVVSREMLQTKARREHARAQEDEYCERPP